MTTDQQEQERQQKQTEQQEQTGQTGQTEHEEQAQQETRRDEEQDGQDEALFADDEAQGLRSKWEDVQRGFVDEPREAVQKADDLVSDLVERLTKGFAETRSGLEEQWNKGEEASTEDLRVALTRYRAFFQRLLKV
jgi:signal recognition particle GTPase